MQAEAYAHVMMTGTDWRQHNTATQSRFMFVMANQIDAIEYTTNEVAALLLPEDLPLDDETRASIMKRIYKCLWRMATYDLAAWVTMGEPRMLYGKVSHPRTWHSRPDPKKATRMSYQEIVRRFAELDTGPALAFAPDAVMSQVETLIAECRLIEKAKKTWAPPVQGRAEGAVKASARRP